MLEQGNKILIAHRRMFQQDEPRYFVGTVDDYEAGIVKVTGRSFVRDTTTGDFLSKEDIRTKIVSITSGFFLIYQLPDSVVIEAVHFFVKDAYVGIVDGTGFMMNLTEKAHGGSI